MFDKFLIPPILMIAFAILIAPLEARIDAGLLVGSWWTEQQWQIMFEPRLWRKIFWPAMAAVSVILVVSNRSRLTLPPNILCLLTWLLFAGASASWAYNAEVSFNGFLQQAAIITSITLPILLVGRAVDVMLALFLCFALTMCVNVYFVLIQSPMIFQDDRQAYSGIYTFKGELGEAAAIAFLLALREILLPNWRRLLGIIVIGIAIFLVVQSDSRGSFALALLAPSLAVLTLFVAKKMRIPSAIVAASVPVSYIVLSNLVSNFASRLSSHVFGDPTLNNRIAIWDFVEYEIGRKPLLGWGHASFWIIGPDGPSKLDAPGWIATMPSGHNGYLDTMVEMGYVGLVFLGIFIFTTLFAIGRVADRDATRGWFLLSIAFYAIITNLIETGWMRGNNFIWLLFLFAAAEAGRYWHFSPRMCEPVPPPKLRGSLMSRTG